MLVDARRRRLDAGVWARPLPGVIDLEPLLPRTIAEARLRAVHLALVRCGDGAVAVGAAALVLHRNHGLPSRIDARAVRADGQHRRHGSHAQHDRFPVVEVEGGLLAASVPSAIVQAAPQLGRLHLVAVVDAALTTGQLSSSDDVATLATGRRGAARLRTCLALSDGRAESFLETWARLQCVDAGIPPTTLQLEIRAGGSLLRGDLAWRLPDGRWLVVEIDGADVHASPTALYRDRLRQNLIVADGRIVLLRFTAEDLRRPGYVPNQIRRVLTSV
ncbi:hypothetical protein SERN_1352 [Serinibacter arcticus]|uniref:DUF559 domain-containing protein n=1 Tax=Serinibacter arcticus TaxID=1655435 RepID=A0A4Z1E311_9MICO|nr:hypothetical protein SERN_1352 [Serinibacter arcticus]